MLDINGKFPVFCDWYLLRGGVTHASTSAVPPSASASSFAPATTLATATVASTSTSAAAQSTSLAVAAAIENLVVETKVGLANTGNSCFMNAAI